MQWTGSGKIFRETAVSASYSTRYVDFDIGFGEILAIDREALKQISLTVDVVLNKEGNNNSPSEIETILIKGEE
jgi:hypothetical protein